MKQKLTFLLLICCYLGAVLLFSGCHDIEKAKKEGFDSAVKMFTTDTSQHGMVTPDFTDMGVSMLITNGRMRMSQPDYNAKIALAIEAIMNNPSGTFSAPGPDLCNPPLHLMWGCIPPCTTYISPPSIPWFAIEPQLQTALTNTKNDPTSTVFASLKTYIETFWTMGRFAGVTTPQTMAFELIGLNAPMVSPSPGTTGKFTSVTASTIVAGTTPSTYRVVLSYTP